MYVLYSISRINNVLYSIYVLQNNEGISTDEEKTMEGGLGGVPPPSKDI
jgi:hypothetical protein